MAYDTDSIDEMLDSLDSTEAYDLTDSDEAIGHRRHGPLPRPRAGGYSHPRPTDQFVTQTQLQAAMQRVGADVKTNADAVKTVNSRLVGVAARQEKDSAAFKKSLAAVKADVKSARDMSLMMLLLQPKPTLDVRSTGNVVNSVSLVQNSGLSLPLMMMMMMGSGSSGGDGKSGMDDMMLPLMLMMMPK